MEVILKILELNNDFMMMEMFIKVRKAAIAVILVLVPLMYAGAQSYNYKPIKGFSDETNAQLEAFFDSTFR